MDSSTFNQQINYLKDSLLGLFKQKTQIIAQRESSRFQYLSSMKLAWSSLLSAIMTQMSIANNPQASNAINFILSYIQQRIPMTTIGGANIQGWATNPNSPGSSPSVNGAGFLSPTENLIITPFDPVSGKPAYQIYSSSYWTNNSPQQVVASTFISTGANALTFVSGIPSSTSDRTDVGQYFYMGWPPSLSWLRAISGVTNASIVEANYDFLINILMAQYNGNDINTQLGLMRALYSDIITKTQSLLQLQVQIDLQVSGLNAFVSQYQAYAGGVDVNSIITDLQNQADNANVTPPPPAPDTSGVVVAAVPVSVDNSGAAPVTAVDLAQNSVQPTASSSGGLWLAAAAVVGTILLKVSK